MTTRPLLLTRRARERAAGRLLARLARYAAAAEARIVAHARRGEAVRALVWLEMRLHVADALRRLRAWVEGVTP